MYWSSKNIAKIPAIADAMSVNGFFRLRSYLYVVNINKKTENDDRLWKDWLIFDCVSKRCHEVKREEFYSSDEIMISYFHLPEN